MNEPLPLMTSPCPMCGYPGSNDHGGQYHPRTYVAAGEKTPGYRYSEPREHMSMFCIGCFYRWPAATLQEERVRLSVYADALAGDDAGVPG